MIQGVRLPLHADTLCTGAPLSVLLCMLLVDRLVSVQHVGVWHVSIIRASLALMDCLKALHAGAQAEVCLDAPSF